MNNNQLADLLQPGLATHAYHLDQASKYLRTLGASIKGLSLWQPIETAPKDGNNILIYGNWTGDVNGLMSDKKEVLLAHWVHDTWYVEGSDIYAPTVSNPTYWMHLPEPPQGE